jgi:hypothetical protein
MSTSILNVWVTNLGDPGSIANDAASGLPHAWVIAVMHCDGRLLNWSETRYRFHKDAPWTPVPLHTPPTSSGSPALPPGWYCDNIPTKDGHVELEVPPGSYVVRGSMHTWMMHGQLFGNWATDHAVVTACGGGEVCATLFAPTAIACCIPILDMVFPLLFKNKIIDAATNRNAEALRPAIRPEAASAFERGEFEVLRRAFAQMHPSKQ